jgi:hypothetical protein
MERSIRIFSLITVIGVVALVGAQAGRSGPQEVRGRTHDGAQYAARVGGDAHRTHTSKPENVLQQLIEWNFCLQQNHAIELAKEQGRNQTVDDVIKLNCYHMLTVMEPDQQQHEMHDVWQTDVYVPNDAGWAAVCRAPSLAREILTIDPLVAQKIQTAWDEVSREDVKDVRELGERLMKEPGFNELSAQEKNVRFHEEYKKVLAKMPKRTPAQNYALALDKSNKFIIHAMALVNDRQHAEVRAFLERYERDLREVMAGKRPAFINP